MMIAIRATLVLILTVFSGCAGFEPGIYPNLWTQCTRMEAYGLSGVTMYGPIILGYVKWERNITCSEIPSPQKEQ